MSDTGATITVRLIKSFDYRTFKNVVLHNVDLENTTVADLKGIVGERIQTTTGFKPYLNNNFDTMKTYTKAFGSKTTNLIINLDHDEWILDDAKSLASQGIENETEISYFNRALYEQYKQNPEVKW
ncbi:hypothetical protein HK097_009059 [Rhizophlyctis rosea]|uniref:Uncharacterized protein n=1 Tax=Rhizophlyctis rosea TaxID=64517 RepID=A0AAD5SHL5_9FUNG|nr:hypothetical protein HK097_009059 [Rhizophlyctis rosea]